jgi:hypothetical protein
MAEQAEDFAALHFEVELVNREARAEIFLHMAQ